MSTVGFFSEPAPAFRAKPATNPAGTTPRVVSLRTPRWRAPRFNGLALALIIGAGVLLALAL
ncbi:MAG: hypothetical protein AAF918_04710 [Pseudomonadota bacterium]